MSRAARRKAPPAAPLAECGRIIVVTRAEMQAIDRLTIERGTAGDTLMERAGIAAADVLVERFPRALRRGVVVVAGKGNNGGDGLVIARHLRRRRIAVQVFLAAPADGFAGDARTNLRRWQRLRGRVDEIAGDTAALAAAASRAGVVVDALFGTGLRGTLDEHAQAIVETMNASPSPIFAVDLPSGLDADTGAPLGSAVQATLTVTFAYPKVGLLLFPGAELGGEVVVADIGVDPAAVAESRPRQRLLTDEAVARALPTRDRDSHKGTYGHVLVLAGAVGKTGAALLCGRAALRAGAGLATIASPAPDLGAMLTHTAELMTEPLPGDEGGWRFSTGDRARFLRLFDAKSAVVLGPGIGVTPATRALVEWLIASSPVPMVIDADGLNCLAGQIGWLRKSAQPIILTPHPGEMARLAGCSTADVQADRVGAARRLAESHGVTVVLKGARTVIAAATGMVSINATGNPGMASGGMGDALAGITASLLAQGLSPEESAEAAVFWHGAAADRVAGRRGEAGLLASDLIEELAPALCAIQGAFAGRRDDAPRD